MNIIYTMQNYVKKNMIVLFNLNINVLNKKLDEKCKKNL